MTEQDWATCGDPEKMLAFLQDSGKLSERKARLFAVACCRRLWTLLTDERSRRAVETAEKYADGLASVEELDTALTHAHQAFALARNAGEEAIVWASAWTADAPAPLVAQNVAGWAAQAQSNTRRARRDTSRLLFNLVGPIPFRTVSIPMSLVMSNGGIIRRLAEQAYERRLLHSGHLDPDRLAVVADALEESDADAEVVGHLRCQGPHVRGCFAVDLVLSKD